MAGTSTTCYFVTFKQAYLTAIGFDFNNYDDRELRPGDEHLHVSSGQVVHRAEPNSPAQLAGKAVSEREPEPDTDTHTLRLRLDSHEPCGLERQSQDHDPEQRLRRRIRHQHRAQLAAGNKR